MKRLLLCCVLFLFTCKGFAQDNRDILSVLETQTVAWNRGDIEGFMEFYHRSDSLLFVSKSGPVYGWQKILDRYKKSYPDKDSMGTLRYNVIKIKFINNKNVFVLGGWEVKRNDDELEGYFTLMMQQIDGVWKIVSDHTSG
ncbi:MAG: nuclear transport factor 2 family protein [Sphingobacteriaceae bacterium]|nr:MAG: nuclear transport factor 2 family protein [Sphingobacteriaceae bacterium]